MKILPMLAGLLALALPARADDPRVVKVENGGLLFTDNPAGVSGTDCGYSLPVGRQTLWLFGDVFLLHPSDPAKPYVGGVSNCALLVPAGMGVAPLRRYTFLTDPATGLARPVLPNEAGEGNETRLWAGGGWFDAAHQRLYLYFARIRTTGGGGPFDFRLEGHGLARADTRDLAALRFERLRAPSGSDLWWKGEGAVYGAAVVADGPDTGSYLYVVGVQEQQGRKTGRLARVPKARIEAPDAYEYLTGTAAEPRWSRNPQEAADVEGLADFPSELSVAWNAYLGGYLAVHSISLSDRLRLSLAPHPWGPYRLLGEIGAPKQAFSKAFCYAGKEHPELAEGKGRVIYITYVENQRYWLQLLKVTLEK